jgi:hypothetical protein
MLTPGVTIAPMAIVIGAEVAVAGDGQVAEEVITQDTACPLVRVVVVYVGLFVPTLVVPTFH